MVFLLFYFPPLKTVNRREEGIALRGLLHKRQHKAVGQGKGSAVDRLTADDEDFLIFWAMGQRRIQRRIDLGPLQTQCLMTQHHIPTAGQRTVGQRLTRLAPHDDGMAHRERLEMRHVGGQLPRQTALTANDTVERYCGDEG